MWSFWGKAFLITLTYQAMLEYYNSPAVYKDEEFRNVGKIFIRKQIKNSLFFNLLSISTTFYKKAIALKILTLGQMSKRK